MTASSAGQRSVAVRDIPVQRRGRPGAEDPGVTRGLLRRAAVTADDAERQRLRDEAVARNLAVARSLALRYRNRGLPVEDLVQVACVGLVKAVRGFDPALEHDFLAYAVPTITGELKRYFRDYGWTVRPPRSTQELRAEMSAASARLTQRMGRSPTVEEVAADLGVDAERVVEAISADGCFTPTSLDAPLDAEGASTIGDQLAHHERGYACSEARVVLAPVVRALKERDRMIIEMRFVQGLTQQQIGDLIGVSQMQVSRLLTRILRQLRQDLEDPPARP